MRCPATVSLVSVTLVVFAGEALLGWLCPGTGLESWLWNTPLLVRERLHLWQPLTANFVHGNVLHLGVDVFFLVWLGPRVERLLGSWRFAVFYLAAGVFAYAFYDLAALAMPPQRTTGGASACVLALLTVYVLAFPRSEVPLFGFVRLPVWWILLLFVLSDGASLALEVGTRGWVNNLVHLAGAAFGLGYWFLWARRRVP
jgi:membrane associated rhomboid family serine protease